MSRELVLHVGLPKTATTTLQRHILPQVPGYHGQFSSSEDRLWIDVLHSWRLRRTDLEDRCAAWASALAETADERVVLSNELLSGWPSASDSAVWPVSDAYRTADRTGSRPLLDLIALLQSTLNHSWRLRVILTVRAQSQFLASLYAQNLHEMRRPGQADFETKIVRLIEADDPFCDYAVLTQELQATVTRDDMLVLVHEDGFAANARRILTYLGSELEDPDLLERRELVRSDGRGGWQGERLLPVTHRGALGRLRRGLADRIPRPRGGAAARVWDTVRELDRRITAKLPRRLNVGPRIELTDTLTRSVQEHFEPSNARLEGLLGRDLPRTDWSPSDGER